MFGCYNPIILRLGLLAGLLPLVIPIVSCDTGDNNLAELSGFVRSGDQPVDLSTVTLYSTVTGQGPRLLGQSQNDVSGFFSISYRAPSDPDAVLYLTADRSLINSSQQSQEPQAGFIRLATVLGTPPVMSEIVINERTTVATAYALAQFINPTGIDGTVPGLQNAAATARNLVNVQTGDVGSVLGSFPNGNITSAMATFNSLANLLAACVRTGSECPSLFSLATTPRGDAPENTFQAAVNIAHFPWQNVEDLLSLSQQQSLYSPALGPDADLKAWTLAIRYQGNGQELDGPGNIAFDKDGNAWIINNYVFQLSPFDPTGMVCGGEQLLRFTPTGEDFPGAPYQGGGVYGAGFGVTLDPSGDVWVGNFGFQGSNCPNNIGELSQTVSQFASDGTPISPNSQGNASGDFHGGWQGAGNTIRRPQGTVSDPLGNIWIANCGGDSITQFPSGDPDAAFEIAPLDNSDDPLVQTPFGLVIDPMGHAWVTSNANDSVFAFDTDGALIHSLTGTAASVAGIIRPMGIASDALGNIWVANSGIIRPPCGSPPDLSLFDSVDMANQPGFTGENASVTMIRPDGMPSPDSPFKGGGLIVPWGIAVDGNGNIWVANFDGKRVSELCGATPESCPPGFETGDPISPNGGYSSNALVRNTGVAIDPSGNVWLANNWETVPIQQNPGGHEIVVFIGLAKPVKTPLIGPPNK
ncbi:MAG: NHL repeat-containing protein [Thermodesulfobacteriota bacterium]